MNMSVGNKHSRTPYEHPTSFRSDQVIPRPPIHPQQHTRLIPQAAVEENSRVVYTPSRMTIPSVANHPRLDNKDFTSQDCYHFGPGTNYRASHHQSELFDQPNRSFQVDSIPRMISRPSPRYRPELSYPTALPPPSLAPSERGYLRNNEQSIASTREFRQERQNSVASVNNVHPRTLWRFEAEEQFGVSSRHGPGLAMNLRASSFYQDSRRLTVDDGVQTMLCQPHPSYHPDLSNPSNHGYQIDKQMIATPRESRQYRSQNSATSRHDSLPDSLQHSVDKEHVGDSAHYGDLIHPARYSESENFEHERKRPKIDDGRGAMVRHSYPSCYPISAQAHERAMRPSERTIERHSFPSNNPGEAQPPERAMLPVVCQPRQEQPISSNVERPQLLWVPEDEQHLTELHCFVRKHCVFIFCATSKDVRTPRKGRKKALRLGQIGIGCLYCSKSSTENKLKGSTYFPICISGIYNATMIIQQRHFPVCPGVSREHYCKYNALKGLTARSASTKEYWISAAKRLGLVDTSSGVFFRSNIHDDSGISPPVGVPQDTLPPQGAPASHLRHLVEPTDKIFATEYSYLIIEQMTTCEFTEADRLGKRKCHKLGFPGMACKHCYGCNGSGRFFPLTLKTFSDVSKSIHVLRNHLVKCTKAPSWMAETVKNLYERHKDEKLTTPFGSQKIFFELIWRRLHPELPLDIGEKGIGGPNEEHSTKAPPRQNIPRKKLGLTKRADAPEVDDTFTDTPIPPVLSPPVIHRGNTTPKKIAYHEEQEESDDNDDTEHCA